MRKALLSISIILIAFLSPAQSIKVLRITDMSPVPNVFVYNHTKTASALSDQNGLVDTEDFKPGDTLTFQHPTYEIYTIDLKEIRNRNNRVMLIERLIDLKPYTVSASRWESPARPIPSRIVEVPKENIRHQNPQTAADVIATGGQVFLQKSQLGGGSPMIRGFSANSLLLVIDGVRLNNAIYRSGNLHNLIALDAQSTESAEVIFGPGTVIYGSDALGGVIHYSSLKNDVSLNGPSFDGLAFFRYSSANDEHARHVQFHAAGKKISSLTSISWSDYGDLKAGKRATPGYPDFGQDTSYVIRVQGIDSVVVNPDPHIQKNTGYSQFNLLQKFSYVPSKKFRIDYNIHHSQSSDIPRYDRLIRYKNGQPEYAEWYYGPQKWHLQHLKFSGEIDKTIASRYILSTAYQHFSESRNSRKLNSDTRTERTETVNIFSVNLDLEKEMGEKHLLDYGVEVLWNGVNSEAYAIREGIDSSAASTRYPDGGSSYSAAAAYIGHNFDVNSKLTLRSGIRYTYTMLQASLIDTSFFPLPYSGIEMHNNAVNGSLGAVYEHKGYTLKAMAGTGFRSPNIDDVAKIFDSEPGSVIVPNPDLRPEYAYNLELSISKDIRSLAYIQADVYYTLLRDAMVRSDFTLNGADSIWYDGTYSRVQTIVNTGSATIYGFTVRAGIRLQKQWHLSGFITYTYGRDTYNDVPLRHAPPTFGQMDLHYQRQGFRASMSWSYNLAKPWDELAPSEQSKDYLYTEDGSPAWSTFDLKLSYSLQDNVSISGGIENILDQHYRPYSSGISAPGRNFIIAIRAGS